jgi:hypothetical protein
MKRLTLLLLCACGPSGPGQFNGTVQSNTLRVADAVYLMGQEVWLTDHIDLCALLQKNTYPKGGTLVKIAAHPVATTGDFTVAESGALDHTISFEFLKLDATCNTSVSAPATAGTATLTTADAMGNASGTFDVTFGSADKVTGTFNATYCNAMTSYPSPTCEH